MKAQWKVVAGVVVAVLVVVFFLVPSKESRRAAIDRALRYDSQIANKRSSEYLNKVGPFELIGDLFGGKSQSQQDVSRQYAARLRTIPLDGCPGEFKSAYRAHIAAWEAYDDEAIRATWYTVSSIAYKYGVAVGD